MTVLLPLVIGAVAIALITVLKDQSGVQNRLSDSHDAQLTSTYFVRDIQGASEFETSAGTPLCSQNDGHSTYQEVLGLEWGSSSVKVSYVYETGGTGSPLLRRWYCAGATTSPSTVAHGLRGTQAPAVCVWTGSVCGPPQSTLASLSSTQYISITVPDSSSGFAYSQLAAPRLVSSTSTACTMSCSQNPQTFSLILLGGGGSCPILNIKQNGNLKTGSTGIDSMAINSTCSNAIVQGNNSTLNTTSIYTEANPPTLTQTCNTGCQSPLAYPSYYNPNGAQDPYASLTPPSKPATKGMCTPVGSTWICTPGYYSASSSSCPPSFGNSATVTFLPSTSSIFYFDNCTLALGNSSTLTANGVLVYFVNGATFSVGKSPGMNITAASSGPGCITSGPFVGRYPCIALWVDKTDVIASIGGTCPANEFCWGGGSSKNGTITIAGNSTSTPPGSAIYMPDAGLTVSDVQTLTITQAVLENLTIDNVGTTEIG